MKRRLPVLLIGLVFMAGISGAADSPSRWLPFGPDAYQELIGSRLAEPSDAVPRWNRITGELRTESDELRDQHDQQHEELQNRFSAIRDDRGRARELFGVLESLSRSIATAHEAMEVNRDTYLQRLGEIERTVWILSAAPVNKYDSLSGIERSQVERIRSFAHATAIELSAWWIESEIGLLGEQLATEVTASVRGVRLEEYPEEEAQLISSGEPPLLFTLKAWRVYPNLKRDESLEAAEAPGESTDSPCPRCWILDPETLEALLPVAGEEPPDVQDLATHPKFKTLIDEVLDNNLLEARRLAALDRRYSKQVALLDERLSTFEGKREESLRELREIVADTVYSPAVPIPSSDPQVLRAVEQRIEERLQATEDQLNTLTAQRDRIFHVHKRVALGHEQNAIDVLRRMLDPDLEDSTFAELLTRAGVYGRQDVIAVRDGTLVTMEGGFYKEVGPESVTDVFLEGPYVSMTRSADRGFGEISRKAEFVLAIRVRFQQVICPSGELPGGVFELGTFDEALSRCGEKCTLPTVEQYGKKNELPSGAYWAQGQQGHDARLVHVGESAVQQRSAAQLARRQLHVEADIGWEWADRSSAASAVCIEQAAIR